MILITRKFCNTGISLPFIFARDDLDHVSCYKYWCTLILLIQANLVHFLQFILKKLNFYVYGSQSSRCDIRRYTQTREEKRETNHLQFFHDITNHQRAEAITAATN